MTDDPTRIAITPERIFPGEPEAIATILDEGRFDYVHLRHPDASENDLRRLIEAIDPALRPRLRLHDHHHLAAEYALGGIHLNRRNPANPGWPGLTVGISCHSLEEIAEASARGLDYATLSPIFDSLSKPGYTAAFSADDLRRLDRFGNFPVIALGGVTHKNVEQLKPWNFAGYAMLTEAFKPFITPTPCYNS